MKVFVFEYVTGGGFAGQALPDFLADGELMWRALVDDLIAVPGVEVLTLRDVRLDPVDLPGLHIRNTDAADFERDFQRCLHAADAVWLVAPESDHILEALTSEVLNAGKVLLGCRPEAVRIAASKIDTARCLSEAGVAVVPTGQTHDLLRGRVVIKPDDGVGCQDTLLCADAASAQAWCREHGDINWVYQPYVEGEALSLSLLCCAGRAQLLSVNRQQVELEAGRFHFQGVSVNALNDPDDRYATLAARVAKAIPGLWGYVGIDLIASADGPRVLEINPRITVSYAGLRAALGCNLAQRVLALPEMRPCHRLREVTLETADACVA
jgi:predicted ATP-grasp superfamily ATP-dependent carboligase